MATASELASDGLLQPAEPREKATSSEAASEVLLQPAEAREMVTASEEASTGQGAAAEEEVSSGAPPPVEEPPPARRCSRIRCFAALAPVLDIVSTASVYLSMPRTSPVFGWTAQMPLALCWLRQLFLAVLVGIAFFRGDHASEPGGERESCTDKLVLLLSEAFSYVLCVALSAPCVVRLITEKPDAVSDTDANWFWAAVVMGAFFTAAQAYWTIDAVGDIRKWAQRWKQAHAPAQAADGAMSDSRLGIELLSEDAGGAGVGIATASTGGSTADVPQTQTDKEKKDKEEEENKSRKPTVKKLLALLGYEWPLVIQASIFLILAAVMEALIPHYVGEICDAIIQGEQHGTLAEKPYQGPAVKLALVGFGCGMASSCRGATFLWIGCKISARLRQDLFDMLTSQEIGFFDTTKTGELTSRMTQDCQKVTDQVTLNVNVFLRTLVTMITTLIFMFTVSPPLTLVAFISVPIIAVISKKYGKFMQTLSEKTQKSLADANAVAEEGLSTMATIRMFAAERLESRRFYSKLVTYMLLQQRQARFYILYLTLTMTLPNLTTALILCYGGKLAMHGQLKSARLLAFVFYLQTLNSAFSTLGDFYSSIVQAMGAATRIFELKEREPKLPLEPSPDMLVSGDDHRNGELKFVNIHFTYPARPDVQVLNGLNLSVPAGKTAALVGPSGNGKTTVISLMKRLYKAEQGQVLLDGIDIWRFPHEAFHRCISIVGQEPVLYARSIRENITYGLENPKENEDHVPGCSCARSVPNLTNFSDAGSDVFVSDSAVEEATRTANAHNFILDMPKGFDTEVGERGVQLSGGQKQRIAIARALVRKPRVLLLDEATSALDAESERQVQQAIDAMITQGSMTVVIIAHRLSTVRNSHKICMVKGGQVVEEGTHDDLVHRRGEYFKLVESQLSNDIPK